jgi:hypothetical protein
MAAVYSPAYVSNQYRALQQLYRWLTDEEEIETNPLARMRPPLVPEQPFAVHTADQLAALLHTCSDKDFARRRDLAILSIFIDRVGAANHASDQRRHLHTRGTGPARHAQMGTRQLAEASARAERDRRHQASGRHQARILEPREAHRIVMR